MLVSVASFLPIIIVGPISDLVGTTAVIFVMAVGVAIIGVVSVVTRGPLRETDAHPAADPKAVDPIASALGADRPTWHESPAAANPLIPSTPEPAPPAAGPIPPVAAPLTPEPNRDPEPRAGPADPTDRD
jgi:hypothetical protein